jgi:hypothetical protein
MKRKLFGMMGVLALALTFGMMVVGCSSLPKSFQKGSGGETTVLLRQGLDFDQAFREVLFVLNRHGFEPEMIQADVGYVRTRWIHTWNDTGKNLEAYRVRIVSSFNPSRTQVILNAEAEYLDRGQWVRGWDTRAIETLRTDLTQSIGN